MLTVDTFSEAGGHPENEDAFAVRQHPIDPGVWLCVLADGQGGQAGGGLAARLACRVVTDSAVALSPGRVDDPRAWSGILRKADEAVRADPAAGFTTLVGLCVAGGAV